MAPAANVRAADAYLEPQGPVESITNPVSRQA
jgi:hypothetical protein